MQNFYPVENGTYSDEISTIMLSKAGFTHVIVWYMLYSLSNKAAFD